MGAVCQIALDIPPEIVDGLAAGIMTRSGSVVRNSAGQIVAHLKETELGWSSPVEWCNRFVSFGVGYALRWSGGSSCPVGWGVSRDLVRMSRLR